MTERNHVNQKVSEAWGSQCPLLGRAYGTPQLINIDLYDL